MIALPPDTSCSACGADLCERQRVISGILGGKEAPRCLGCLSEELGSTPEQVCKLVGGYLVRRECYRNDWIAARPCAADGQTACCPSRLENAADPPAWYRPEIFTSPRPDPDLVIDAEESGCGDLMVLLMRSIRQIEPGQVLEFTARDPGAAADIPAWSRLTGHPLLSDPVDCTYLIRRKPAPEP